MGLYAFDEKAVNKLDKELLAEFKKIKEEFKIRKLEIQEEQKILEILEKVIKPVLKGIKRITLERYRNSDSPRGNINEAIADLNELIKVLKKDEKIEFIINKEDRYEEYDIKGELRRLKDDTSWAVISRDGARAFKKFRVIQGSKKKFEIRHKELFEKIVDLLVWINRSLDQAVVGWGYYKSRKAVGEINDYLRILKRLIRKEIYIIQSE